MTKSLLITAAISALLTTQVFADSNRGPLNNEFQHSFQHQNEAAMTSEQQRIRTQARLQKELNQHSGNGQQAKMQNRHQNRFQSQKGNGFQSANAQKGSFGQAKRFASGAGGGRR